MAAGVTDEIHGETAPVDEVMAAKDRNVLVVGLNGSGKSSVVATLANLDGPSDQGLLRKPTAEAGEEVFAIATKALWKIPEQADQRVTIIDTVGLDSKEACVLRSLEEASVLTGGKIHACLLVVKMGERIDPALPPRIVQVLGKRVWKRSIVVFTHARNSVYGLKAKMDSKTKAKFEEVDRADQMGFNRLCFECRGELAKIWKENEEEHAERVHWESVTVELLNSCDDRCIFLEIDRRSREKCREELFAFFPGATVTLIGGLDDSAALELDRARDLLTKVVDRGTELMGVLAEFLPILDIHNIAQKQWTAAELIEIARFLMVLLVNGNDFSAVLFLGMQHVSLHQLRSFASSILETEAGRAAAREFISRSFVVVQAILFPAAA